MKRKNNKEIVWQDVDINKRSIVLNGHLIILLYVRTFVIRKTCRPCRYDGVFIDCALPDAMSPDDLSLSVSLSESAEQLGVPIPLVRVPKSPPESPSIAACVSPMFGSALSATHLIAWIEMNRIMGVQHFFLYVYEMNPAWVRPLAYYQAEGLLTMFDWDTKGIPTSRKAMWPPHKLSYITSVNMWLIMTAYIAPVTTSAS